MATPAAIVAGAQRVSIASARLDAVGEALATRVSGVTPTARRPPRSRGPLRTRAPLGRAGVTPPRTQAPPTASIVSARAVKRWGPPLNVWSRFASFPRCASRLH